jgi:hypothetical protein
VHGEHLQHALGLGQLVDLVLRERARPRLDVTVALAGARGDHEHPGAHGFDER